MIRFILAVYIIVCAIYITAMLIKHTLKMQGHINIFDILIISTFAIVSPVIAPITYLASTIIKHWENIIKIGNKKVYKKITHTEDQQLLKNRKNDLQDT